MRIHSVIELGRAAGPLSLQRDASPNP